MLLPAILIMPIKQILIPHKKPKRNKKDNLDEPLTLNQISKIIGYDYGMKVNRRTCIGWTLKGRDNCILQTECNPDDPDYRWTTRRHIYDFVDKIFGAEASPTEVREMFRQQYHKANAIGDISGALRAAELLAKTIPGFMKEGMTLNVNQIIQMDELMKGEAERIAKLRVTEIIDSQNEMLCLPAVDVMPSPEPSPEQTPSQTSESISPEYIPPYTTPAADYE